MRELVLRVSDDHVASLARESDPLPAVVELVWNAVDGEATTVSVELERDDMDAISVVRVVDNGHGIGSDEVEATFGRIGGSWKNHSERSKNRLRYLHGKHGQGRLRAFALGSRVVWSSVSDNTAGERQEVTIFGSRGKRDRFPWDVASSVAPKTGTKVTAHNDEQRSLAALDAGGAVPTLRSHFAPVLLNDNNLTITFDGATLDPQQEIALDTRIPVTFGDGEAVVRIIEWRSGKHRAVYFGPDDDHFPYEEPGTDFESQFAYSTYVTWSGLGQDELAVLGLRDMAPGDVGELWKAVRAAIQEHFVARRRERRREQVKQWKELGIYPYQGEPTSDPERAERAVFDVVSGTANLVASRHKFLAGLEHLLFDPDDSGDVRERDHLHKILEQELWVFGEGYHLMSSERSLTELLRNHLKLEGLPDRGVSPVRRWDGKSGRTDLHLAARYKEHDRIRHLVVELKAPDIIAGRKEIDQVEDYTNAVLSSGAFAGDKVTWDFILVVTDYDDVVRRRIGDDPEIGLYLTPPKESGRPLVRAYVRRWRDIIDENRRRLDFMVSALEHDPSITEGLEYVRQEYQDLLPESLLEGAATASKATA
jgi:hypothetical protein